ncbi:hypothetical protein F4815DRAFT_477363 [Daldinia loculata]|nr:hypothetical protein F4815DRAFT_478183 [Daldinia loculata]KAI2778551.1 hypothetical protein F4815DRAFT_477363 [Daldinia loculata]
MLKGRARQYYYDHLVDRNGYKYTFPEMVDKMGSFFHTVENRQMFMNEWHQTNINTVMRENPDKDIAACMEILIARVQRIQKGLFTGLPLEENLAIGMIHAVQGHPAFLNVTHDAPGSFEAVCSKLRAIAGSHVRMGMTNQANQQTSDYNSHVVERKYHGGKGPNRSRRYGQQNKAPSKRCFVCKKPRRHRRGLRTMANRSGRTRTQ